MIKFFRNIRRRLLRENRFTRYLIYALGEIILVVLGILIALQIDNWNENKLDRRREAKLLIALHHDFKANAENLTKALAYYPLLMEQLEQKQSYLGLTKDEINDSIEKTLINTFFPNTKIYEGSLQVLLNSESLQLVSNDSLKRQLTSYPAFVSSFKEQETAAKDIVLHEHRPIVEQHVNLLDFYKGQKEFDELRNRTVGSDYEALVQDRDYQNVVIKEMYHIDYTSNEASQLLSKTNEILSVIETDIKILNHKND